MSFPLRYVPHSLTKKDKLKQIKMIKNSKRLYKKGIYKTRKKVNSFKSKSSPHLSRSRKIYKIDKISASRQLAKATGCSIGTLRKIINKGRGAYFSSGSRPNQTAHSWGIARLASSISGGKAAAVDLSLLTKGCKKKSVALRYAKRAKNLHGSGTKKVPKYKGSNKTKGRK